MPLLLDRANICGIANVVTAAFPGESVMAFCAFPGESAMAFAGDEAGAVAGELGADVAATSRLRSRSLRLGPGVRERLRPRGSAFMALGAFFMAFGAMSTDLWTEAAKLQLKGLKLLETEAAKQWAY